MKKNTFPILETTLFVLKLYIKNAPFKMLWECMLYAVKNVMTVITAVWLLDHLTKLIISEVSFFKALFPLIIVTILNILVNTVRIFYDNCLKPQSDLKLRTALEKLILEQAKHLPIRNYENEKFYTTVQQAQDSVPALFSAYDDFVNVFAQMAAICSAVKVAVDIDPILLLFVLFTIPTIAMQRKIGKVSSSKKMDMKLSERKKNYAKEVWMNKNFVREFKTSNASRITDRLYEDAYEKSYALHSSYGKRLFQMNILNNFFSITSISILSYLYCIVRFVYSENFDVAAISVIVVAIMNMVSRCRKIYQSYGRICGYQVQFAALDEYLQYEPENENVNGTFPTTFKSLEFCHVWFSYNHKNWTLKDVSFKINAGEKISVVGYNGAGKSTLIKLILRFYDVDRGQILFNGRDIRNYQLCEYRKRFFAAFQESQIFSLTLAENILMRAYASKQKADIDKTLKDYNAEELHGKETRILGREFDENGIVLSGGQQQKIAISRMDFSSFDIALLDEPSAALDPISSQKMLNTVLNRVQNKTMIMVSHDMAFSKYADRILFFEGGLLTEIGSHSELIKLNSKYAMFFRCQAEVFQKKEETQ